MNYKILNQNDVTLSATIHCSNYHIAEHSPTMFSIGCPLVSF